MRRYRASPYRGFEWGYWLGRLHDAKEEYTLDYKAPGKAEVGHISANGSEVGIVDYLTATATIVDRAAKQKIRTVKIDIDNFSAGRTRWLTGKLTEIRGSRETRWIVSDPIGERELSSLGDSGKRVIWARMREHSDFALTYEEASNGRGFLNLWNAVTGKKVVGFQNNWQGSGLATYSTDGRYLLVSNGPALFTDGAPQPIGEATLTDLATGRVVDRFPVGRDSNLLSENLDGLRIMFRDRNRTTIRDLLAHQSKPWPGPVPDDRVSGEWNVQSAVFAQDWLISLVDRGRCFVTNLSSRESVSKLENVSHVGPGEKDGDYIVSSSGVRIYDIRSASSDHVVGSGHRLTRYGPGTFNVFRPDEGGLLRIDENDYRHVGAASQVSNPSSTTYSGRWVLSKGASGRRDTLTSIAGDYPPISLPFEPNMWSCGLDPDSIGLWVPDQKKVMAFSGVRRKIRWSQPAQAVKSIWVSPDGRFMFVDQFPDRELKVFDMASGRNLGTLGPHNSGPINLTFSRDGRRAFTCGGDGRVAMWELKSLRKLRQFDGKEQEQMTSADLSPDGSRVVTTTGGGSWQLWDSLTGVQLLDVRASAKALSSALFTSDGKRIVTAGEDSKVRVWSSLDRDPTIYIPIEASYLAKVAQ